MPRRDYTFYLRNKPTEDALVVENVESEPETKRVGGREAIVFDEGDRKWTIFTGELEAIFEEPHQEAPATPAQEPGEDA